MYDDWSSETEYGFYDGRLSQYQLISRLLMYGVKNDNKTDIPSGLIYGLNRDGEFGNINVGRKWFFTDSPMSQ